ncbi:MULTISPECIES: hypothetical protein [Xanthobacter]|uniref:Uncharacterized protein n=1 Tax=Xanthobacter aminoxidans TaxID=186280 RepID=A0ABW6ZC90_9HYPH|nr:hypothetical protein [Xanthobacter sp. 91]
MSQHLSSEDAAAIIRAAGLNLSPADAARIASGISPGLAAFSAVAGTLPFDLEPATFLAVQRPCAEPKEGGQ